MSVAKKYSPTVELPADMATGIFDLKIGDFAELILNYKVIEKTKSYTVMKILSVYRRPSKRSL